MVMEDNSIQLQISVNLCEAIKRVKAAEHCVLGLSGVKAKKG